MPNQNAQISQQNQQKINDIFQKMDRAPMNMESLDRNAEANQVFFQENDVKDAREEAHLIDRILRGDEDLSTEAEKRLFSQNGVSLSQYVQETGAALTRLDLKTVTGLKHKQTMDFAHILLNNNTKTDSPLMDAVKKDVLNVALIMEKNKDKEAEADVIEELEVAVHLAITSCWDYLSNRDPWFRKGIERKQVVYELWCSLACEQRLIDFAYTEATARKQAGNPVALGELFGMNELNRRRIIDRPKNEGEEEPEEQENLQNAGQAVNAGPVAAPKLSREAAFAQEVFGVGYDFTKAYRDPKLKDSAKKAEAQKLIVFKNMVNTFVKDHTCAADINCFGRKVRLLQKADNSLYIIDNHRQIPVPGRTCESVSNQIESVIMNNTVYFDDAEITKLLSHYRSNMLSAGESMRTRQAMIDFIVGKAQEAGVEMVPNEFSNVSRQALVDFTDDLMHDRRQPAQIADQIRNEINTGTYIYGIEFAEMMERNKNRDAEEMNRMVVMNAGEAVEVPMEAGWTAEETVVKNFIADFIFSQNTWEMDISVSSPDAFVADMILSHKEAVIALLKNAKEAPDTDMVKDIMEKMSIAELGGELNGSQVKLAEVITEAMNSLTGLLSSQLARFDAGGDLAQQGALDTEARIEYLFRNQDEAVRNRLRGGMREGLAKAKRDMDTVVDKAGQILQANVVKMTGVIFPEQEQQEEVPLQEQTLTDIIKGAAKSTKGQGKFIRTVLNNYFGKVSTVDKRAMLASVIRSAKCVKSDDLTDDNVIEQLKKQNPQVYENKFQNREALTEEERQAIEDYRKKKIELRTQSNYLAGLLRGAGPLLQKMMQGLPTESVPPEIAEALADMKSNLQPIPEEIVKTRFAAMVESSGGAVTKIEKLKSLGAASVGEAFLCKVYGPGKPAEGKKVVIKLLRPEVANRMDREEPIMLECASMTDAAMRKTYEGQIANYRKELDLSIESKNCTAAKKAYKEKVENNKDIKGVKTMEIYSDIQANSNSLVAEQVEGDTLDSYIRDLKEISKETIDSLFNPDSNNIQLKEDNIQEMADKKAMLLDKIDQAVKRRDHLINLCNVWISQGVCDTGFYHGDLHAGNIIVNDEAATFIDFGNAIQLTSAQQSNIAVMMLAASLSTIKKYTTVEVDGVEKTVVNTKRMEEINEASVQRFFDAFNAMLKECNSPEENAAYTPEKQAEVRAVIKAVLKKGGENDTGQRINAVIIKVQELGVKVPPAMQNFSQGQIRLQNSIDEMNEAIEQIKEAADKIDHAIVNIPGNNPVLIVQSQAEEEHSDDPDIKAGEVFRRVLNELSPLDEEEFTNAILDNTYKEGDKEEGIREVNKRKEFEDKYYNGIKDLKTKFGKLKPADREAYKKAARDLRGLIEAYKNDFKDNPESEERRQRMDAIMNACDLNVVSEGLFNMFGGMDLFSFRLLKALQDMDTESMDYICDVLEKYFPMAMELEDDLKNLRAQQDSGMSKEQLKPLAKAFYQKMDQIWEAVRKRKGMFDKIGRNLDIALKKQAEAGLAPMLAIQKDNIGSRMNEKLEAFRKIKEQNIVVRGATHSVELKPEHKAAYNQAKSELMAVIREAVPVYLKEFTDKMHSRKPNYKVVNFDKVMDDVITQNRGALGMKVGFFNAAWAVGVLKG